MTIKKLGFSFGLWIIVVLPLISFAIEPGHVPTADDFTIPSTGAESAAGLLGILGKAVGIVWKVFFIIAVLFILIAAFNYLTAGGDEEKIKTAHKQITWAMVAIAVALLSVSFSVIIQSFIMNKGTQNVGDIYNEEYGPLPGPDTKWQPYIPPYYKEQSGPEKMYQTPTPQEPQMKNL